MMSSERRSTSGSLAPNGYLRWAERHIERMSTPVLSIARTSWRRSAGVHSRRSRRASDSSTLIST